LIAVPLEATATVLAAGAVPPAVAEKLKVDGLSEMVGDVATAGVNVTLEL
jgi:hypothetical protein